MVGMAEAGHWLLNLFAGPGYGKCACRKGIPEPWSSLQQQQAAHQPWMPSTARQQVSELCFKDISPWQTRTAGATRMLGFVICRDGIEAALLEASRALAPKHSHPIDICQKNPSGSALLKWLFNQVITRLAWLDNPVYTEKIMNPFFL